MSRTALRSILRDPLVCEFLGTIGTPYDYGKGDPSTPWPSDAYDCSGFVQGALVYMRLLLPTEIDRNAFSLAMVSDPIAEADIKLGDLAFYRVPVSHVMLCLGSGWVLGASGGRKTTHSDVPNAHVKLKALHYQPVTVLGRLKPYHLRTSHD